MRNFSSKKWSEYKRCVFIKMYPFQFTFRELLSTKGEIPAFIQFNHNFRTETMISGLSVWRWHQKNQKQTRK